jgi:HEPN domain-containing protein
VISTSFGLAREVFNYAKEEFEKALKLNDVFLYRNAADRAFLALVIAINAYIKAIEGVEPTSHSERRMLRKMGREDLRALYSDLMKTLHGEAFYEGVYQPEEVEYALKKVEEIISKLEEEVKRKQK